MVDEQAEPNLMLKLTARAFSIPTLCQKSLNIVVEITRNIYGFDFWNKNYFLFKWIKNISLSHFKLIKLDICHIIFNVNV